MSRQDDPSLFDDAGWSADEVDDVRASTWGVGELHRAIGLVLTEAFGSEIWVEGEIRNLNRSAKKHVYFDLIDSGADDEQFPPLLSVTLFSRERQMVNRFLTQHGGNVRIGDGLRVRIRGRLNTYASRSSLQLRMTAIDPTFTLGVLDQLRDRVLAVLSSEKLLERNARVPLSPVPLRIAVITSVGSAAYADVMGELTGSGTGLQICVLDARVQGLDAEPSILAALDAATRLEVDVILLVRGGGARTDLAAFDLESVARAIATAEVPVITGIGHEIDSSIADMVAHSSHKTPTAAAAMLVDTVRGSRDQIESDWVRAVAASRAALDRVSLTLTYSGSTMSRSASRHLTHEGQHLDHLWKRLTIDAARSKEATGDLLDDRVARIDRSARHLLQMSHSQLGAFEARSRSHDPRLALARGWSITRTASGKVVRSLEDVIPGESIETLVTDGVIQSEVTNRTTDAAAGADSSATDEAGPNATVNNATEN